MKTTPTDLNPLGRADAYELEIIENIFSYGTTFHPKTYEFTPWAFEDWELTPENVGTGKPALIGHLRDDSTFNDGEAVTAEDVKFTVNYATEQEVTGMVAASQFGAVEEVTVDSPKATTVNYFFKRKDNGWFSKVLGSIILPKHIWKDVADHSQYSPRKASEGVVGSGPMVLSNFDWENWFELKMRPAEEIPFPQAEYVNWIHDDAPFIDGLRIEVFGSQSAMQQAVLNGDIDLTQGSFGVDRAVTAKNNNSLSVKGSPTDGWNHHSYNVRRIPLDDPAFRQLLVMVNDQKWAIDELMKGIGAVDGSYATLPMYEQWRPPEPSEMDEYKGIAVPDLAFPGNRGSFQLDEESVQTARDFLLTHDRATYDYSFGQAKTDLTKASDGKELYVDGKHLSEVHTDNKGNDGQWPLEMSFNPPDADANEARIAQRWVKALQTVGIPVKPRVVSFDSQVPQVFNKEAFDMFAMSWTRVEPSNNHFQQWFGHWGADIDSTKDSLMMNPMGYTGADDLIEKQANMLDPEERKPVVKQVLAQLWADAPTDITYHALLIGRQRRGRTIKHRFRTSIA